MHTATRIKEWVLTTGVVAALILSFIVPLWPTTANAATGSLGFELLGTHPQAVTQSTAWGKMLHKLEILDGKLYAGYGDYNTNTGPIHINPFDLESGTFTGSELSAPTEQISQWRIINGKLYAPYIDPIGGPQTTGGYAVGEPWVNNRNIPNTVHQYDMATLTGTDLWVVGSGYSGGVYGATAWRSTDDGDTWSVAQFDTVPSLSGYERYYWVANLGGKIYVQANNINPATPVRIFDGTSWTDGTTEQIAPNEAKVVVFDGKIVTTKNRLSTFDGTNLTTVPGISAFTRDLYVSGSYLYVLRLDGTIARTTDLQNWQELGNAPTDAASIAEHDGVVYVGTANSQLFASTESFPTSMPSVTFDSPTTGATLSDTVELTATPTSDDRPISSVQWLRGASVLALVTDPTTFTYNWDTTTAANGSHTLTVRIEDDLGNVATDSVTVTVQNATLPPPPDPDPEPDPQQDSPSKPARLKQDSLPNILKHTTTQTQTVTSTTISSTTTSGLQPATLIPDPEPAPTPAESEDNAASNQFQDQPELSTAAVLTNSSNRPMLLIVSCMTIVGIGGGFAFKKFLGRTK